MFSDDFEGSGKLKEKDIVLANKQIHVFPVSSWFVLDTAIGQKYAWNNCWPIEILDTFTS